jgi:hypothetical protein
MSVGLDIDENAGGLGVFLEDVIQRLVNGILEFEKLVGPVCFAEIVVPLVVPGFIGGNGKILDVKEKTNHDYQEYVYAVKQYQETIILGEGLERCDQRQTRQVELGLTCNRNSSSSSRRRGRDICKGLTGF